MNNLQSMWTEWERGIGVAEAHAAGPVRQIPVTVAMQEAERRRSSCTAVSEDARAWRESIFGPDAPQSALKMPSLAHRVINAKPTARQLRLKPCNGLCGRSTEHSTGRCNVCRKHDSKQERNAQKAGVQ